MTKKEKFKIVWDKCMELAPNRMDMVKVNFNRTLKHLPKPNLKGKDFFALTSPRRLLDYLFIRETMTEREMDKALSSLGLTHLLPKLADPTRQLLADLEAIKQLPDDTSAAYIKGQITEATQRYYDTR